MSHIPPSELRAIALAVRTLAGLAGTGIVLFAAVRNARQTKVKPPARTPRAMDWPT